MHELQATTGTHKEVLAILAPTAVATDGWYLIASAMYLNRVTRHLHYPSDEEPFLPKLIGAVHLEQPAREARRRLVALTLHGISKNHLVATLEIVAVKSVHYHSVALLQLRRKPTYGHREDSECVGADCPSEEQRQHQREDKLECYFQFVRLLKHDDFIEESMLMPLNSSKNLTHYLMSSTNLKRRFQRMPEKPG